MQSQEESDKYVQHSLETNRLQLLQPDHPSLSCRWHSRTLQGLPLQQVRLTKLFTIRDYPRCAGLPSLLQLLQYHTLLQISCPCCNITHFTSTRPASCMFPGPGTSLAACVPCTYFTQGTHSMNLFVHHYYQTIDLPTTC